MQAVLIAVQLVVSIALVIVVLLQRSEGGALGMGGGGSGLGGLFSPRGAADTLTQTTIILGALFFLSSIGLTLLSLHGAGKPVSILDSPAGPSQTVPLPKKLASAPSAPAVPAVPKPQ